ncbi:tetratricopeptide repeat protein [Aquimarina intermedia]|uniref:Tetratricopeptide repeat protein n=2 Tax=Aquimarina intermedia TaxID=350814 RepID=A0A5S5BUG5_9FLAO|nr:tetratricopeptide repeat protein [Aquimarina intermedia]
MMKNRIVLALLLSVSAIGFSQKQALKSASKALKSGDIEVANEALKAAEAQLSTADEKQKAQYYYLKAEAFNAAADKNDIANVEGAAMAYAKVVEIENAAGNSKYSGDASEALQTIRQSLVEKAIEDQNKQNYKGAADKLYLGYKTNKTDTIYLYYAASNAVNGKDYDTALNYYNELKDLGFTGIQKEFVAINKETGEEENFPSKSVMNIQVKAGEFIKPQERLTDSKKAEIAKNIALIYISQGKDEEAMQAMADAKKENPNDASLLQAEADMFYKLGNIAKYKEIMEQIVANDPENPDLYYNLGVSASKLDNNEQAIEYYKKALELKPDYGAAQLNIASIILSGESAIVEKMNALGTSSSDYKKYDALKLKREELYKSVIPYLDGALKSNPDNVEVVRTLMNIYYQIDDPRAEEMNNKLKALEGGN